MVAAKKMVRELKGKEQAIKWGIIRNDKKEVKKVHQQLDKEQRDYYEIVRRQFIDFVSQKRVEDTHLKSIWLKESSIELRLSRLSSIAADRLLLVERFRADLENAKFSQHLQAQQITRQNELRAEYIARLQDERAWKEERELMEKIVEVEERRQRRRQEIEFEEFQILKEQQEVMKNIEILM